MTLIARGWSHCSTSLGSQGINLALRCSLLLNQTCGSCFHDLISFHFWPRMVNQPHLELWLTGRILFQESIGSPLLCRTTCSLPFCCFPCCLSWLFLLNRRKELDPFLFPMIRRCTGVNFFSLLKKMQASRKLTVHLVLTWIGYVSYISTRYQMYQKRLHWDLILAFISEQCKV